MKRVGCLYRVSTKKQTYNNDIPVQKEACRKFIKTKNDWTLEKEYMELGVSGYKVGEKERDVLQTIKKDVSNNKIDILLVFMFDRIGRREDETPFVVKWLIDQGIEVWSVNEGQREIKNSYDRLINYITYWQAQGESEKISIRAKEERIRLTKLGIYMGYYAPFGYKMVESDLYSKIGKQRKVLEIYEEEAKTIRLIYNLIAINEYGTDKVAIYLNNKKIKRRKKGILWDSNAILEIVKNPIYKGYVSFGKRNKMKGNDNRRQKEDWIIAEKRNDSIVIISEEIWEKANNLIISRKRKSGERVLRLLSGYTRCGYCGNYIVPKGKTKYTYMLCKGKQKTGKCEYRKNYRVDILEGIVSNEIKIYLDTYKKIDLKNEVEKRIINIKERKEKVVLLNQKISNSQNRIVELKNEIVLALMENNQDKKKKIGDEYNSELENLAHLNKNLEELQDKINKNNKDINNLKQCIPVWSKEFENAPLEIKRQILDKLIDKVYLYNDKVEIRVKYPISTILIGERN